MNYEPWGSASRDSHILTLLGRSSSVGGWPEDRWGWMGEPVGENGWGMDGWGNGWGECGWEIDGRKWMRKMDEGQMLYEIIMVSSLFTLLVHFKRDF